RASGARQQSKARRESRGGQDGETNKYAEPRDELDPECPRWGSGRGRRGPHKPPLTRRTSQVSARIKPSAAFHSPCRMYNDGLNRSYAETDGSRHGVVRGTKAGTVCSQRS